jgi:predicted PurR-regulated permease PerM
MTQASAPKPPRSSRHVPPLVGGGNRAARREFDRRVVRATLLVNVIVLATLVAALLVWRLRAILLLVVVSLFLAAILRPIVGFFERRGLRRGAAAGVVYFVALCGAITIGIVLVHPLVTAATHLVKELPRLVQDAQQGKGQIGRIVRDLHLLRFVKSKQTNLENLVTKIGKPALAVGKTVISGVVAGVTIIFLTFFLLLEFPQMVRGILAWMQPERSERVRSVLDDVGTAIVGYMLGNFLTSVIAGITIGVTLLALGVPYPAVLAIWVGLVDFLPLIGGLLAGVPTVVFAALHSLTAGIVTLVVFLVYQEIENHVLNPVVMSKTVKLNPLWVLLAVLLGASIGDFVASVFGGFVGALLAVPAAGAVQVIARDLWEHKTGARILGLRPDPLATGAIPTTPAPEAPETRR